jgi:oligoribonuclease
MQTVKSPMDDKDDRNQQMTSQNSERLVWIDLEMTGLNPDFDRIIEIATVITNDDLELIAEGPVLAIHQSEETLAGMDAWNQRTHHDSGLIERVRKSKIDENEAEQLTTGFVHEHVPEKHSPLCGNTICQDRRFLFRYMPQLESWLHYRNLDVSTLKELASRWRPELPAGFRKKACHRALDDILESIEELRYYRDHFLRIEKDGSK